MTCKSSSGCPSSEVTNLPLKTTYVRITLQLRDVGWVLDVMATDDSVFPLFSESWMPADKSVTLDAVVATLPELVKRIPR